MVYPQRDKGTQRTLKDPNLNGGDPVQFIQPFSQKIVASPVVRIRVGDTIHSNASTSAFAKIFGGTKLIGAGDASDPEKAKKAAEAIDALGKLTPEYLFYERKRY